MTQEREYYATTVDEALGKAANELGLPTEEISYSVLDEGNSGFLGIGARDARILVTTSVSSPQAPVEEDVEPLAAVPDDAGAEPSDEVLQDTGVSPEKSSLSEVYGDSSGSEQEEAPQDLLDDVRDQMSTLLDAMGFDARVEVYDAGGF